MKKYIHRFHLYSTILMLQFSTISYANESLEGVTVYDQAKDKTHERLNLEDSFYKPYSKDVIGNQRILEENIPDITEAVRDVPGVTINESGAFKKEIKIRGLQGSRVVTLIDGIKVANQGTDHSGSSDINMTDISSVEKIEVIKGSPSVIYDPGASGGVVNVVTSQAQFKKGIGFKQKLGYDEGYNKKTSSTQLEASTGNFGVRFIYTLEDARDYKISGEKQKEIAIARTESLNSGSATALPINDLGYSSEAISTKISGKVGSDGVVDLSHDRWMGKDMASIHGQSIGDATVLQYDRVDRETKGIGYRKKKLGGIDNFNIKYSTQTIFQAIGKNAIGTNLETDSFNLFGDILFDDVVIKTGAEVILDEAETLVKSDQDYYAAFVNAEYLFDEYTLFIGGRYNYWEDRQVPLEGSHMGVAEDLVGISGITPEKTTSSPTWSVGLQYQITDTQNISINTNTTFRNPNLYERYAFGGGYLGGGMDLKPEEGKHIELSWKYLDDELSITANAFYSDFKNYLLAVAKTRQTPAQYQALVACVRAKLCDPLIGDYDDRESDFFSTYHMYTNAEHVTNRGAEVQTLFSNPTHEFGGNISFNETHSNQINVDADSQPLNITAHYKYKFLNDWKPWIKGKVQHVEDIPKVKQHQGFNPYTVANLYAGFKKSGFVFSSGIRNVTNETYHVAYNGINALERTYFASLTYDFHTNKKK